MGSTLKEMIGVDNIPKDDSDSDYDTQDTEKSKFDDDGKEKSGASSQQSTDSGCKTFLLTVAADEC